MAFNRQVIRDGARVQIWIKTGGNWTLQLEFDDYREQYGPYAR